MFEYRRDFNHTRQVAPCVRVAQSNSQVQISVIRHFTSVRWHHWMADKKCIWQSLKWFCEARWRAHMTKPGWSKPHTHSNPTNLALFRLKVALYRFNQGAHNIAGELKWEQGGGRPPSL